MKRGKTDGQYIDTYVSALKTRIFEVHPVY